jgi:hypothetical protein
MNGYKLVRKRADGSYGPLFIHTSERWHLGDTVHAGDHPTKGYAHRPGLHAMAEPRAPHMNEHAPGRVWVEVDLQDVRTFDRPRAQGGTWYLADQMTILREVAA